MRNDRKSRRAAALKLIADFRRTHNLPDTPLRAERRAGRFIVLIGHAADRREYGVGYSVR